MGVKPWLVAGLLLIGLGASAASIDLKDPRLSAIKKFYEDCNFIAENCPRQQIAAVLLMIQRKEKPEGALLGAKGKRFYAAIHDTQEMIFQPDPLINALPSPMAYGYTVLSARAVWTSELTASIEVTRQSVETVGRKAGHNGASQRFTVVDEWFKVGDAWKVRMVRYILT
jgi:hypothetical protein